MYRILVVDDEASLRGMLSELLSEAGYDVETAESAETALEQVRNTEFHIVITDIRLGGMSGIDLVRHIRAMRADVEVVVMTSYASFSTAVEALRLGAYDYLQKPFEDLEDVLALVKRTVDKIQLVIENRRLMEDLRKKNEELEVLNLQISELAVHDGLTGLYNYRYLHEMLKTEVSRSQRHRFFLSLLMIDVDHFKHYNDHHGHLEGDEALKRISRIFMERARGSDTVARSGGEEFVVVLPETTGDCAAKIAEDFRKTVSEFPFPNGESQPLGRITISLGVAEFPADAGDPRQLVERADQALYQAKAAGRNRVCSYGALPASARRLGKTA